MKSIAYGFAVILIISVTIMPGYASKSGIGIGPNGGICRTVTGNVTFGQTYMFTSTQTGALTGNGSPTSITYVGEDECVIENGVVGDSAAVTYMVSGTCTQGNDTSAINCPMDGGIIGVLSPSGNACNNPPAATHSICKINRDVAATSALIPLGGATTILTANVTVNAFPDRTSDTVAQLGSVSINVPGGFDPVPSPEFYITFNP